MFVCVHFNNMNNVIILKLIKDRSFIQVMFHRTKFTST